MTPSPQIGSQNHYSRLPKHSGQDRFRLLELKPGEGEAQIICELRTVNLSDFASQPHQHSYEAVSHVWGSDNDAEFAIRVGSWPVPVRKNLFSFLQQVRDPKRNITLWIDALCINQADDEERARQVKFMDQIYKGAQRALVWLGTEDGDVTLAMDVIERIAETPASASHVTTPEYQALLRWAERPYWTRCWVVQEFLLARDIIVILGERRVNWSTLSKFMHHVQSEAYQNPSWLSFVKSHAHTLMRQRTLDGRPEAPLARLLVQNQHTQCKLPCDRVFAMLGLALPTERGTPIQPSYTKDLRRLVFDVLDYCQIPPKDVVRYVRFLYELLGLAMLDNKILSSTLGGKTKGAQRDTWKVTGFSTGRIVWWNLYDEHFSRAEVFSNYPQNEREMVRELRSYTPASVSRMLKDLGEFPMAQLQASYAAIKTLNGGMERPEPASLTIILTSECDHPEILLGLAIGNVKKSDSIVYFLGHRIGLVLDASKRGKEHEAVKGVIVCSRPDDTTFVQDTVTKQTSSFWTVQTEAELATTASREHFQLSPTDLLQFAR